MAEAFVFLVVAPNAIFSPVRLPPVVFVLPHAAGGTVASPAAPAGALAPSRASLTAGARSLPCLSRSWDGKWE